ncbi:TnsD family Tn7-like transposition protein [Brevibacillus laterosporus]|uniref:Transposase n=1 Tax=Brevibacillus laterosporus TaxID=1465 RepID=A0AAP8QD35_BRELA|nr:TnsD family Tn7-like transposition protein [Brevibacillus laterosporus]PPA93922.1 transposase [Brevibacillus laterosporus]
MLTFFTNPYPDELLYSAVARYHYYTGNLDLKDTLEEVFGSRNVSPSVGISTHLEAFVNQVGGGYTIEEILQKHSVYPYYAPFLSREKQQLLVSDAAGQGQALYTRLGVVAGGICKKDGLFYCPACAKEDVVLFGEAYIHRQHQIDGIFYCGKHSVALRKYPITWSTVSRIALIRFDHTLMDLSIRLINDSDPDTKVELILARMAEKLMKMPIDLLDRDKVRSKYHLLLRNRNLMTATKSVRQTELHNLFTTSMSLTLLKKLESDIDINYEYNWLRILTRKCKRHVHPLRHLLMLYFLDQDIEGMLEIRSFEGTFGHSPWPCLNKAAPHFNDDVITRVQITRDYKTGDPIGTFICSCGFVYARKGPDQNVQDRYRIGRVKNYGSVWMSKLEQLNSESMSIRAIARTLGVDSKTVLKYLSQDISERILIKDDKKIGKIEHSPFTPKTSDKKSSLKSQVSYRVNWSARDNEYCVKIKELHNSLLNQQPSVRITKSILAKHLGKSAMLDHKLNSLPQTKQLLAEIKESVQQFQIRRCKQLIDQMIIHQEPVILWKVQRIGGIKSYHFHHIKPLLERYIHIRQGWCIDELQNS